MKFENSIDVWDTLKGQVFMMKSLKLGWKPTDLPPEVGYKVYATNTAHLKKLGIKMTP